MGKEREKTFEEIMAKKKSKFDEYSQLANVRSPMNHKERTKKSHQDTS